MGSETKRQRPLHGEWKGGTETWVLGHQVVASDPNKPREGHDQGKAFHSRGLGEIPSIQ